MKKLSNIKNPAKKDSLVLAMGFVLFIVSWYIIAGGNISSVEESIFRQFNNWPAALGTIFHVITYLGSLYVLLAVCLALSIFKKYYLTLQVFIAGFSAWCVASLIKFSEIRMRPYDLLNNVKLLEPRDLTAGFPSAHTALITAVVVVLFTKSNRKLYWVLTVAVVLVGISRMVVGMHAPIDITAGVGIGLMLGSLTKLIFTNYNDKKQK